MSDSAPLSWRDRRFVVLFAFGFAAGVPLPLTAFTLRQWFAEAGLSLAAIGLTALIGLAYALKFLWAPLFDRLPPRPWRRLGRRRGWLIILQPALVLAIVGLGHSDPVVDATHTVRLAVAVAFLSASQDIVIDAYRIEALPERAQGMGLACYVWGYRGALLAAGGGALAMAEFGGWAFAYAMCAAMIGVGFLAAWAAPEERLPWAAAPVGLARRLRSAVIDPFRDFLRRRYALVIVAFVALFKLGEALAGIMTPPFYRALGFTRLEVASVVSVFGLAATLLGALAGGLIVAWLGTARALILSAVGQMLSNLMYVALFYAGHDIVWLFAQVGVENFTDGLADAAFVTYLSGLTNRAYTATQYALLSSLAAVPLRSLGALSGWLAEALGWPLFFLMTAVAALPAMVIMAWLLRHLPPSQEERDSR